MLRLFVGIDLPPELKLAVSLLCAGVPSARWVDAGNLHVTLRFIGEVDDGAARRHRRGSGADPRAALFA